MIIPFIVLLVWFIRPSSDEANRYNPPLPGPGGAVYKTGMKRLTPLLALALVLAFLLSVSLIIFNMSRGDGGHLPEGVTWGIYGSQVGPFKVDIKDGQFYNPVGVAVASDGSVYVAETLGIQKYTSEGVYVSKWGTQGTGDGEFSWLDSVAVASDGSVYVADTGNSRIQKFTSEGVYVSQWGTEGTRDGQFKHPRGVAVAADGSVYVADTGNHRIQKFTSEGVFITKWAEGTAGQGNGPHRVAVAADGSVYVADEGNNRIQKFTSEGVFVSKWGTEGAGDGQFDWPTDVAVAADGSVYVADERNHRIQKFTSEGVFITKWGTEGAGEIGLTRDLFDGVFHYPRGVAVAADGSVYVADNYPGAVGASGELIDWKNGRILKFSPRP